MVHTSVLLHWPAKVPPMGIDHDISQNVMCVYNFDMRFMYVHVSWEGDAHDSRVMQEALGDLGFQFPWVPKGEH